MSITGVRDILRTSQSVLIIGSLVLSLFAPLSFAQAADTGFFSANQTVASNSVDTPDNGWTSNSSNATFNTSADTADYGFPNLNIPAGATIDGIAVTLEGRTQSGRNLTAAIWKGAATTSIKTATLTTSTSTQTLGGATDKWGTTWTVADFADATFKIRVGATLSTNNAYLNAIQVKVFYTTAAAPACSIDTVANLVENPCFEAGTGNTATSWVTNTFGTAVTTFSITNTDPHSGTRAAQVTMSSYANGDAKWVFQTVPVVPGEYYTFSDWYKATVPTELDIFYTPTGGGTLILLDSTLPASATWKQASTSFMVPSGVNAVVVAHILAANGTLTTDDYSLVKGTPPVFNKGMVTLTFDDGWKSGFNGIMNVLQPRNLKATAYINSGPILGSFSAYMTQADMRTLQNNGHEVAGHGKNHLDLTQPGVNFGTEITQDRNDLKAIATTSAVTSFAYPFGAYNDAVISALQGAGYTSARAVDRGFNFTNSNKFKLKIHHVINPAIPSNAVEPGTDFNTVKSWIDQANADKVWLILMFHRVEVNAANCLTRDANGTPVGPGQDIECVPQSLLTQIADYIVSSNTTVATMAQGVAAMGTGSVPGTDTTPPVITTPVSPMFVEATSTAGVAVPFIVTAIDNVSTSTTPTCTPPSNTLFGLGTTTVTCTAHDAANNFATSTFNIVVREAQVPVIVTPPEEETTSNRSSRRGGGRFIRPTGQVLGASSMALTDAQIASILALLASFGADQEVINKVTFSLKGNARTPTVQGASTYLFVETLRKGSYSNEVGELQKRLTVEGIYSGPITTFFGPLTEEAVKAYQTKNDIPATGLVGPLTRTKLNDM